MGFVTISFTAIWEIFFVKPFFPSCIKESNARSPQKRQVRSESLYVIRSCSQKQRFYCLRVNCHMFTIVLTLSLFNKMLMFSLLGCPWRLVSSQLVGLFHVFRWRKQPAYIWYIYMIYIYHIFHRGEIIHLLSTSRTSQYPFLYKGNVTVFANQEKPRWTWKRWRPRIYDDSPRLEPVSTCWI